MEIKELIKSFNMEQDQIDNKVSLLRSLFEDESAFWLQVKQLNTNDFKHHKIISLIADALQMVNSEKLLAKFELSDIADIYSLLVKFHPHNIQYRVDEILFTINVLDDENAALKMIKEAIEMNDEYRADINKMLSDLPNRLS